MTRLAFLDQLRPASAKQYQSYFRTYFRELYSLDPKVVQSRAELEALCTRYFGDSRDYKADVGKFFESQKSRAPSSVKTALAVVKTLFSENEVELPSKFWKTLAKRVRGSRARTLDRIPSNEELKRILIEMSLPGRTLYSVLASSGMRIGESLQLKVGDIDLSKDPAQISIRGEYTKSGNPRFAFVSSETKELLERWLPQRSAYIEKSAEKAQKSFGHIKAIDDDRVFPFSMNVAGEIWENAVKKVGLLTRDPSTGRATLHPHCLRKFFRTKFGAINVDLAGGMLEEDKTKKSHSQRHAIRCTRPAQGIDTVRPQRQRWTRDQGIEGGQG